MRLIASIIIFFDTRQPQALRLFGGSPFPCSPLTCRPLGTALATMALLASVLSYSPRALAQELPSPIFDAPVDNSRVSELLLQGQAAAEKGRFVEAHTALVAAWELRPSGDVAGMLGEVELKLGKARDAAEHLSYCLRTLSRSEKPARKAQVEKLFAQARAQVSALQIRTNVDRAVFLVDGRAVGVSPLIDEVFVEPGSRVVEAKALGFEAGHQNVDAARGSAMTIDIALVRSTAEPEERALAAGAEDEQLRPRAEPREHVSESASYWRLAPIAIGTATAAVGFGVCIGSAIASGSDDANADLVRTWLRRRGGPNACTNQGFSSACQTYRQLREDAAALQDQAIAGFVVGAIATVATTVFISWPRGGQDSRGGRIGASARVSPSGVFVLVANEF